MPSARRARPADAVRGRASVRFLLAVYAVLLLLSACGKVGPPEPPFLRIPEAVKDLAVAQSGHFLVLTWTTPPHYIDGSAATNLAHVQIRTGAAPLVTMNAGAPGKPQSYQTPVGQLPSGARTFSLVVETSQGKLSMVSNAASITPVEVPGSISGLTAVADQRRIFLRWNAPLDHAELADAYLVARTDLPAETETVMDTKYEDARYLAGKPLTYQVTAARRVAGALVPGVASEARTVIATDKTPPTAPVDLEIRDSGAGGFLTWDANGETDIAGYRVYRSDFADRGFTPVIDRLITTNNFVDPDYRPGAYYAVSAIDDSGNASSMSAPFRGP